MDRLARPHARQPWGEWLLGILAVKMAVRARRGDLTYAVALMDVMAIRSNCQLKRPQGVW